jgi:farnesyl-diphosphate farnesyltransferase
MQKKKLYHLTRSVSRSFYLTLRFLPTVIRETACIAYLLARISDTLADTATIPAALRLHLLRQFQQALYHPHDSLAIIATIQTHCLPYQTHAAERHLIRQLPFCLTCFTRLPPTEQQRIHQLLTHILAGQQFDLKTFHLAPRPTALTKQELDRYTYQVAGCVGEYLSTLFAAHIPHWTSAPAYQMLAWASHYGRGLQLINILRDLPVDQPHHRQYITASTTVVQQTLRQAQRDLSDGWHYVSHLDHSRLRFVCVLPLFIGLRTLIQLANTDHFWSLPPVKIQRRQVYAIIGSSALGACVPARLSAYYEALQDQLTDALHSPLG